jgi:hypothetical protein
MALGLTYDKDASAFISSPYDFVATIQFLFARLDKIWDHFWKVEIQILKELSWIDLYPGTLTSSPGGSSGNPAS